MLKITFTYWSNSRIIRGKTGTMTHFKYTIMNISYQQEGDVFITIEVGISTLHLVWFRMRIFDWWFCVTMIQFLVNILCIQTVSRSLEEWESNQQSEGQAPWNTWTMSIHNPAVCSSISYTEAVRIRRTDTYHCCVMSIHQQNHLSPFNYSLTQNLSTMTPINHSNHLSLFHVRET